MNVFDSNVAVPDLVEKNAEKMVRIGVVGRRIEDSSIERFRLN